MHNNEYKIERWQNKYIAEFCLNICIPLTYICDIKCSQWSTMTLSSFHFNSLLYLLTSRSKTDTKQSQKYKLHYVDIILILNWWRETAISKCGHVISSLNFMVSLIYIIAETLRNMWLHCQLNSFWWSFAKITVESQSVSNVIHKSRQ